MDWGFDRMQMRKYLGYGTYAVCLFNFSSRFLSTIPFESNILVRTQSPHLLNSLEILRRSIWTDIRIENYLAQQDI